GQQLGQPARCPWQGQFLVTVFGVLLPGRSGGDLLPGAVLAYRRLACRGGWQPAGAGHQPAADPLPAPGPAARLTGRARRACLSSGQNKSHILSQDRTSQGTAGMPIATLPPDTRLLLIDDHQIYLDGLTLTLNTLCKGIVLDHARNAAEAEQQVRQHTYDLILLDLHLPDSNGLILLEKLRAIDPLT